jgi:hypothetical protein
MVRMGELLLPKKKTVFNLDIPNIFAQVAIPL